MAGKLGLPGGRCKPPIFPMIWQTRRGPLDLTRRARVMGILNVTPDSFSDGGRHADPSSALDHARRMIAAGADIIDIGGESTRPGARPVSADDEIARTVPVVAALRAEWDGLISIDTMKSPVAAAALEAGADIVNDVSGLRADPGMSGVCAASGCGVVVMHMQGEPRTMQQAPHYEDVVAEVRGFFHERMETLVRAGLDPATLCFDPGIGFGKNQEHNLALLRSLQSLSPPGLPLLLGVSRKSFIGRLLENDDFALRDWPTVAITAQARGKGVMLHRVHDVRPNLEALRMTEAILGS
jgi:dihydropteroate synthase